MPLIRYVKLLVAHAPGMLGTFYPPPTSEETANWRCRHEPRHERQARDEMHFGIANQRWRENATGNPGACETHNFSYVTRGPLEGREIECAWPDESRWYVTLIILFCCCVYNLYSIPPYSIPEFSASLYEIVKCHYAARIFCCYVITNMAVFSNTPYILDLYLWTDV